MEGAPKVYGRGKEVKEIYARQAVNAVLARGRAVVCTYMCVCDAREREEGRILIRARVHVPGGPANKYNAPAWAAIVRTHKVETRAKPTVNRRFRS